MNMNTVVAWSKGHLLDGGAQVFDDDSSDIAEFA
jgi:hypothetical protein